MANSTKNTTIDRETDRTHCEIVQVIWQS